MNTLLTFVCQLVQRGDHALAKVLRNKTMEKMEGRKAAQEILSSRVLLPSISVSMKVSSLLDFKSLDLAEQMTIIDSKLFAKVEVAEALVWAKDQREEAIPNLTKFTEHFNSVSYWVRTRILQSEEQKERDRMCIKFIKIMRNLKKLANFNSIFAILSALDSAPIRRLDWPRAVTEGMKEFSSLIDSSSSFRAYRQVLADTLPPCIPYM
jgi:Rap guanine nucleotide exchange factor 1